MIKCKLDEKSIDEISELINTSLSSEKTKNKDILRLRLSVEEVLGIWAKKLGKNSECVVETGKRFGKSYLTLSVEGEECDPTNEDSILGISNDKNILTAMGMMVHYEYNDGTNILRVSQPQSSVSKLIPTCICFVAPLVFGYTTRAVNPDLADKLYTLLIHPIFSKIMDLLGLLASPLIFLSLFAGVLGIGDKATFDKLGKRSCIRYVAMTFVIMALSLAGLMVFFKIDLSAGGSITEGLSGALGLLLDIIPKDVISPFVNGNAMQVVFLALIMGLACLVLGDMVTDLGKSVEQLSLLMQQIMNSISGMMTGFMVFSLSDLSLSGDSVDLSSLIKFIVLVAVSAIIYMILYLIYIGVRYKVNIVKLAIALFPGLITVFATASLPSVLGINIELCKKQLNVKSKFVNFAVPFGQIVYKPATGLCYLVTALCLAEYAKVPITPIFLITCYLLSSVLAIATPPIPGGAIGSLPMLFSQLGIPSTTIALAINLILLLDNTCAMSNDVCFLSETFVLANKLDMVEKK